MRAFLASFLVATVVAAAVTPLVRRFALTTGALSASGGRNVHQGVIPRLGGVAIALAVTAPILLLLVVDSQVASEVQNNRSAMYGLGAGALIMCAVGAWDDIRGIRAIYKLGVQVVCSCIAYAAGFRIDAIMLPGLGVLEMGAFALPVTVIWIVGITNAVNLIDGLDGLAAGVVFFAASTNLVVALIGQQTLVAVLMSCVMGSLIGFLFYNFNPARIFMGDSGSYFLGFVLANAGLVGHMQKASTAISLVVPVLALGVPIFDTLFSMLRRWLERRPLFSPDRGHLHHRLLDSGLTHRRAVLVLYGISLAFAVLAVAVSLGRNWEVGMAIFAAMVIVVGLIRFLSKFSSLRSGLTRARPGNDLLTQELRHLIPRALVDLHGARSPQDVNRVLAEIAEATGLARLRFQVVPQKATVAPPGVRDSSKWIVIDANASGDFAGGLYVRWDEEVPLSSTSEVLLQLVADECSRAFSRCAEEKAS